MLACWKKLSVDSHVAELGHIIQIPSKPILMLRA